MRFTLRLLSSVVQKRPFYITTPIFYVNAVPHIGHLYTALVADAIQRFEKLTSPNSNIIFSTGTDEHGTKIQQAAVKANMSLPEYCSNISNEYRELFKDYNVEYTEFVRTTEERHKKAVTHFWNKLVQEDYIYKAQYSGWYSVNDESFVPESHVKEEIRNGEKVRVSIESGHIVEWTEESNYMFRLSAFKTHLQRWLKPDGVITPAKYQKQLQDMLDNEAYFPDISVSRPSSRVHWAIRVPNDEEQSIYVWLDALINYLTAIGYPDEEAMKARGRPWPADLQIVGKDILKFHGIYWPAFLMAIKWHPPRRILCHAHWTVDGAKMSKSLGNVVQPRPPLLGPSPPGPSPLAPAALRYVLLREATMASDANYSTTKMVNIANAELADTLGNLASRCLARALNPRAEFPALPPGVTLPEHSAALTQALEALPDVCHDHYSRYELYKAADAVMHTLRLANLFFESSAPWRLARSPERRRDLELVLHLGLETLRVCGVVLQPLAPALCSALLDRLQVSAGRRAWPACQPSWRAAPGSQGTTPVHPGPFVLFQRIYSDNKKRKVKA